MDEQQDGWIARKEGRLVRDGDDVRKMEDRKDGGVQY